MFVLVPRDSLFGIIVGPIFWGIYFVLSYLISGAGCSLGLGDTNLAGLGSIQWLLLSVGVITALLISAASIQAERGRRYAKGAAAQAESEESATRQLFLYTTAVILCCLSLVGTIWLAMAAVMTPVC